MVVKEAHQDLDLWEGLREDLQKELDLHRRELKEITLMLEQSQLEVQKLTQRNASITAHLKQVHAQFDSLPREEIRMTYDSALDAQQRLFVMRGQLEKLQSDQNHTSQFVAVAERVLHAMEDFQPRGAQGSEKGERSRSGGANKLEMMIQAQEAERQRLSRQMHDGPAQALSNFILQTEIAMRMFDMNQTMAKEELANLKLSATGTFQKVRDFIFELRPMMLDDLGLAPTLKRYVDAFKEQSGMDVRLGVTGMERRLESYQEVMIFRAVQELLNNSARHSQATQAKVSMDMGDTNVKVIVDDNGRGFSTEDLPERGGTGLQVIREHVEMIGGSLDIDSVSGKGTRVTFHVPTLATHV